MKLKILRAVCVLLIVAGLGLYVYGIAVKGESFTDNLPRTIILCASGLSALMKLAPKRRPLTDFAKVYAKELGSAFEEAPDKRQKLLEALRLYNEDKFPAAMKALEALRPAAASRDARYAVEIFTALCQTDLGLDNAAIATYEGMIASGLITSQVYSNLCSCCRRTGAMDKAAEAGLKAIELDPDNAFAHINTGNILLEAGDYARADRMAVRAVELAPDMRQSWTLLAVTRAVHDDEDGWKDAARHAVDCGQDPEALARAMSHYAEKAKSAE